MLKTDRKTVLLLHGRRKNAGEEQNVPNRLLTNPAMFPLEIMVMIAIRAGTVDVRGVAEHERREGMRCRREMRKSDFD